MSANLTSSDNGSAVQRLAWGLPEAAGLIGVSTPHLRNLITRGEIKTTRAGRRVLILDAELKRYLGIEHSQSVAA